MDYRLATPRRRDRQIRDESWIKDMLRHEMFCTVATAKDEQPFIRPSAFIYIEEDHAIYIHGAHRGRAFDNAAENERVCLCVYAVGAMRTHRRAFEFFQEQAGVMVFGPARPVLDNEKKHSVMQVFFAKHAPHLEPNVDYEHASQSEIDATTILRIDIERWSGKMKWTDDPDRPRYYYDDILGDRRPRLPWTHDMSSDDPLTAEWEQSRRARKS